MIPKKVWKKWNRETKGMNILEFFNWASFGRMYAWIELQKKKLNMNQTFQKYVVYENFSKKGVGMRVTVIVEVCKETPGSRILDEAAKKICKPFIEKFEDELFKNLP